LAKGASKEKGQEARRQKKEQRGKKGIVKRLKLKKKG
jgi:hypothetical protein